LSATVKQRPRRSEIPVHVTSVCAASLCLPYEVNLTLFFTLLSIQPAHTDIRAPTVLPWSAVACGQAATSDVQRQQTGCKLCRGLS